MFVRLSLLNKNTTTVLDHRQRQKRAYFFNFLHMLPLYGFQRFVQVYNIYTV